MTYTTLQYNTIRPNKAMPLSHNIIQNWPYLHKCQPNQDMIIGVLKKTLVTASNKHFLSNDPERNVSSTKRPPKNHEGHCGEHFRQEMGIERATIAYSHLRNNGEYVTQAKLHGAPGQHLQTLLWSNWICLSFPNKNCVLLLCYTAILA